MMSVPDRQTHRLPAPRSGFQKVKKALTEAEYQAMSASARRDWWPVIRQAIRVWETTEHPGSVVVPGWMPVQALIDLFAEHGHHDVDVIAATILKLEQMTGDIVQRTIVIDGVQYPVVKLTDFGRAETETETEIPPEFPAITGPLPELPSG